MIYLGVGLLGAFFVLVFFFESMVMVICAICMIIYYILRFIVSAFARPIRKLFT